jgi:hypothetical protein
MYRAFAAEVSVTTPVTLSQDLALPLGVTSAVLSWADRLSGSALQPAFRWC